MTTSPTDVTNTFKNTSDCGGDYCYVIFEITLCSSDNIPVDRFTLWDAQTLDHCEDGLLFTLHEGHAHFDWYGEFGVDPEISSDEYWCKGSSKHSGYLSEFRFPGSSLSLSLSLSLRRVVLCCGVPDDWLYVFGGAPHVFVCFCFLGK